MPNELKKITALPDGTPADNDVIPFVDLATNTTKKALKSELKGDTGDAATVDAGTTTTLAAGQPATVTNVGTNAAAIFNFAIPQGIQGIPGLDGASIVSVSFVGNDMVFVLDDTSTVTLTNAKTDLKGDQGDVGAKIVSASFVGDDLVFVLDDSSTVTVTDAKTTLKGDQGIQGIQGVPGNDGADGISFIWEDAYVSETTYQVNDVVSYNGSTYICVLESTGNLPTNTTYWSLMAQKGTDGTGSGDMIASVYDPTSVEGDAFDMDNMAQGTTNKFISDAQLTLLSNTSGTNTGDVTVTDSSEIDFTLTGQDITASLKAGSIDETKLDTSVNASLDKADSAVQPTSTDTLTNKTLEDAKFTTSINAQTGTTYTLVLTDNSKLITLTNDDAITLTIPTNASVAFPIGTQIDLVQNGAGAVTFAGAGVTINSKDGNKTTNGQYVGVSLIKTDTNTWLLLGDLTA
jgi:hypothetical protein